LLGWASQPGAGDGGTSIPTTTGGGNATPVTVTSLSALNSVAGGTTPAVIYVKGVLAAGTVKIGSNKTVAGICGAEFHGHVNMDDSVNVILRNVKIVGYNCSDSPSECKSGADAITVNKAGHHLWFDHLDISDATLRRLAPGVTWWGWRVPSIAEAGIVLALGLAMLAVAIFQFTRTE